MKWIERDVVIKANDNFTSNGARMEFVRRIGPALRLHLCSKLLSDTNSKMTVKNLTSSTNTPQCWYYCSLPSWGKKIIAEIRIWGKGLFKVFQLPKFDHEVIVRYCISKVRLNWRDLPLKSIGSSMWKSPWPDVYRPRLSSPLNTLENRGMLWWEWLGNRY